jgi:diguanylate cyclase (GGDEF)-like protein
MVQVMDIRVLFVAADANDINLLDQKLANSTRQAKFHLTTVGLLKDALQQLTENTFDVVLLSLQLPDGRGLGSLNKIQGVSPRVPIVVLGGINDEELALYAVQAGAQDYLVKNQLERNLLIRSLLYAIERKRTEERLSHLAQYDVVTGLPNRVLFRDRLTRALAHAQRKKQMVALMFLDLDHFKSVNDSLGHDVGDQLLKAVAERLKSCLREGDTIARLGGDEFTIILEEISESENIANVAQKIIDMMSRSFLVGGQEIFITTSIGIATYPDCGTDQNTLIKNADAALYDAKAHGRSVYRFYHQKMNIIATERLELLTSLRHAVDRDEFILRYQPQVNSYSGQLVGVEALLRWNHPEKGLIYPSQFVHLLEDTGLIIPVGEWALREACKQCKAWQNTGLPAIPVSVNISARQFKQKNLVSMVSQILLDTKLDPRYLQLELTESVLVDNIGVTVATLRALHTIGTKLSIDDFGTGYSSLSYLKQFPLHALKIDRSFLQDINKRSEDAAIAIAIITLGHSLRLDVVAEGVETNEQKEFLKKQNCNIMQGHLFGYPMHAVQIAEWLGDEKRQPPISNVGSINSNLFR